MLRLSKLLSLVWWLAAIGIQGNEENSFFVESIEFKGVRYVSQSILRAELKLEEGAYYTEEELKNGQYRLDRLTFIWRSEIALRKGSKRGAYRLVITIEETRRFFWHLETNLVYTSERYTEVDEPGSGLLHLQTSILSLGYRWFFRKSELRLQAPGLVSYLNYDLFGTGAVLNTGFGPTPGKWDRDDSFGRSPFPVNGELADIVLESSDLLGYISFSFPLGGDHWLHANAFSGGGELESLNLLTMPDLAFENTEISFGNASINWSYNRTDHPTFTTSGLVLQAGFAHDWLDFDFAESQKPKAAQEWVRDMGYMVVRRFWELSPDQTFGIMLNGNWGNNRHKGVNARVPEDYQSGKFGLDLLYGRNFLDRRFLKKNRDFRFEAKVGYHYSASDLVDVFPAAEYGQYEAEISFTARDNFGTLRLGLRYESKDRGLWP